MKVGARHYRALWAVGESRIGIVDQSRLPYEFVTVELASCGAVVEAIRSMRVRGAPLIGVAGAYGLALALRADSSDAALARAYRELAAARPTAVNLRWALDRLRARVAPLPPSQRAAAAWQEAAFIAEEDVAINRALGEHGARLLAALHERTRRPVQVLTHCNTGWLATVDYGTALSAIYQAHDAGVPVHVWASETRPRNQGLLTAWELAAHGVPHTLIVDNAAGHLMRSGRVDVVLVGADRVTRAGDVCNKIGTYLKAAAAADCGIPFYAAVPSPTIDWSIAAEAIEIEERGSDEVRLVYGRDGAGARAAVAIAEAHTPVANPAFDITPARLVTGIVTERGVAKPAELATLFEPSSGGHTDAAVHRRPATADKP
ncbi:MAG: S-methyl-5-thioribose-1-phosphate isomerase [Burkholderiaceae bacterium]|nr:S-methyl-5-thioribose-1-phosphate isomerase [Burkholderiaceae bacterium]